MATNYDSVEPTGAVSRWSPSKKEKVKVAQPSVFGTCNNGMGGVDLLDQTANNYRIGIRSKKWRWVLFIQMLNISVVNAWKIHQMSSENRLDLLTVTRLLTRHLLRLGVQNRNQRRTPASVPTDSIFDPEGTAPGIWESSSDAKFVMCEPCGNAKSANALCAWSEDASKYFMKASRDRRSNGGRNDSATAHCTRSSTA
ncbi:hypothetical protein HPB48_002858 [Haemaphysalis longicornis]|uniref:PiggyBac transposable element-derived protein domain-containing protein n=1 Tax=Haemaphysalis longicornis TaxID=44386 RepID=A0A9J6FMW0_HAELO|nr:hypothetical protein HPB48_002858 [Haemaphysalis longicornis]